MKIQKMLVYRQNNSGGYFEEVKHLLKDDLTVVPCSMLDKFSLLAGWYTDIGLIKGTNLPEEIYFNGVEKGIDCGHCGDRWDEEDGEKEKKVFIFETEDELNQALEDKTLSMYSSYAVLEDLK